MDAGVLDLLEVGIRSSRSGLAGACGSRAVAGALSCGLLLLCACVSTAEEEWFVSPHGRDAASGSREAPFRTIQRAIDGARPGSRIHVAPGDYYEDLRTRRAGRPDAPIQLRGLPGTVLRGAGGGRVFEIRHSHWIVSDLRIDGRVGDSGRASDYRSKLLYAIGPEDGSGLTGLRVLRVAFANAGTECLRLKYRASGNEIAESEFESCGVWDFQLDRGAKNGEALYIGTAPEQMPESLAFSIDDSNDNWIHDNRFDTRGNECIDLKEGVSGTVVERNRCTGQRDPKSGGISCRGNGNVIRNNEVFGNRGAGIRLGGDTPSDGVDNVVVGNSLVDNREGALKIMRGPQREICGNRIESGRAERALRGPASVGIDPGAPCTRRDRNG